MAILISNKLISKNKNKKANPKRDQHFSSSLTVSENELKSKMTNNEKNQLMDPEQEPKP